MSYWIIIPDVHGRRFWKDAVRGHEEEKIVFLGDYVDPYGWEGITPDVALEGLKEIIAFKKAHPGNVTLLLGNHDLGYLDYGICTCRMSLRLHSEIQAVLEENLDLFDIVHVAEESTGEVLFSHAGIGESWLRRHGDLLGAPEAFRPERLNELLHSGERERQMLFEVLSDVSPYRGGKDPTGSPVWADLQEYLNGEKLIDGYIHTFGHTLGEGVRGVPDRGFCLDCARAFRVEVEEND